MAYQVFMNEWIGVTENGLWLSPFENEKASWKTKKELALDIGAAKLDTARTPKIKRTAAGKYQYIPKNCDTGRYEYGSGFNLIKLTPENIQHYQQLLLSAIEGD